MSSCSNIRDELLRRGCTLTEPGLLIDDDNNIATFIIYNLSGGICGYQQYNPSGTKDRKTVKDKANEKSVMKYYTHATEEGDDRKHAGKKKSVVWGYHSIDKTSDVVFIVEGIFDAIKIHSCGYQALAILSNNQPALASLFYTFHQTLIGILDRDPAGAYLAELTDISFVVPEGYKDIGDMGVDDAKQFLVKCYEYSRKINI